MPAPCRHNPPKEGCLLCHKLLTDPRFAAIWGPDKHTDDPVSNICEYLSEHKVLDRRGRGCSGCWVYECELFGQCTIREPVPGVPCCDACPAKVHRGQPNPELLILDNFLAPGDAVVLSAAIVSLHKAHPRKYLTAVRSTAQVIWDHHRWVVPVSVVGELASRLNAPPRVIKADYPAVNQSDDRAIHFMQAYCEHLAAELGVRVPLAVNRPILFLSDEEKGWISQVEESTGDSSPYWIVNAGHKADFTAKWWGVHNYQKVVDLLRGKVRFVQVGEDNHNHPPLGGVVDLRGKTDTRQFMRLVWNSAGGLGPSTFLQHLCAAFEKPYVLIAGGREPRPWQTYPLQTMFSSVGTMPCCATRSCWRSRTVRLNDGAKEDDSVCEQPTSSLSGYIPKCLDNIRPEAVAEAIASYA